MQCLLCGSVSGQLIYENEIYRVVLVDDKSYPGYIRIISQKHVKEMSDLNDEDANSILNALLKIDNIVKKLYTPDKINLASLGNVIPHLHWHIIPRYKEDKHFPNPIWGEITHQSYTPSAKIISLEQKLIAQIKSCF